MKQMRFAPGETIFEEGDAIDLAYLIWSGRVDLLKRSSNGSYRIATLGKDDVLGEMGVIGDQPRSATARVVEATVCSAISKQEFVDLILTRPEEALDLLRVLFDRLRTMNDQLVRRQGEAGTDAPPDYRIRLYPDSPEMAGILPDEGLFVPRLPFRVGRKPSNRASALLVLNELELPDSAAFVISPNHMALDRQGMDLIVLDRGSKHGTIVGGKPLGGKSDLHSEVLAPGRTEIVLGRAGSPYRMIAEVERP